ncbi:uncharacterized protein LOC135133914 [Zophobas morio]|uniref:uncharacterized protein LOC135133914 n=1 Tax=Zophobas morio TaxID=2755281 RepID=UPI003083C500
MTTTPVSKSKLSCRVVKSKTDAKKEVESPTLQSVATTPIKNGHVNADTDYSPLYFPLTQETNEEIDVLWDWHSPQTSQRKRRTQKRLIPAQSPKFPLKRHPSNNNNTQNFERLRNELKILQEELAMPDDESCLCVSPQQEMEIKRDESNILSLEQNCDEFEDLFNDSIDEELVLCSQKIEQELESKSGINNARVDLSTNICDNTEINSLINKYNDKKIITSNRDLAQESFDISFDTFRTEDRNLGVQVSKHSKLTLQRTLSDIPVNKTNVIHTASGKLEFHRTKSFELAGLNTHNQNLSKTTLDEIERKRLEAKAKLELKKQKDTFIRSPDKCSPEEIEKKRLQALAKLEAKRIQDIVEKKRQEALKRLQISRMKNASQVKSTLTTRL